MSNKITNKILEFNYGIHSTKQYALGKKMITQCSLEYKAPRMYHIALLNGNTESYQMAWSALCRKLTELNITYRWKGAIEIGDGSDFHKGLHKHIFLVVDAIHANPTAVFNHNKSSFLINLQEQYGVNVSILPPQNSMHDGHDYQTIPKTKPEKVADALLRLSYLYKLRSKPSGGEIYSSSRDLIIKPNPFIQTLS